MDKLLIIVNARSGRATFKSHLLDLADQLVGQGCRVEVHTTTGPGDARDFVARYGAEFRRIISCGGDGTVNDVLNGLMQLDADRRPELAIIPTGTTNDYAYSLGIPSGLPGAITTAVDGRAFPVDVGRFGERYFAYVAAFGLFTRVTYETPQAQKNLLGRAAYLLEGAKTLLPIKKVHTRVRWGNEVLEDDFILGLFTNSVSVGGLRTAFHEAKLDDGQLEITLVREPKTFTDLQHIINILLGLESANESTANFLCAITTSEPVTVETDEPVAWTLDGESGGTVREVTIRNCYRPITVIGGPAIVL